MRGFSKFESGPSSTGPRMNPRVSCSYGMFSKNNASSIHQARETSSSPRSCRKREEGDSSSPAKKNLKSCLQVWTEPHQMRAELSDIQFDDVAKS